MQVYWKYSYGSSGNSQVLSYSFRALERDFESRSETEREQVTESERDKAKLRLIYCM